MKLLEFFFTKNFQDMKGEKYEIWMLKTVQIFKYNNVQVWEISISCSIHNITNTSYFESKQNMIELDSIESEDSPLYEVRFVKLFC